MRLGVLSQRWWAMTLLLACAPLGCERPPTPADANAPGAAVVAASDAAVASPPRAEYEFPARLRDAYPQIAPLLNEMLEAVVRGDYATYRAFVARARTPESPERFELIRQALRRVRVAEIDEVDAPDLPAPTYRVLTEFELEPTSKLALQVEPRSLAILVFREADEWRMLLAPPAFQPRRGPTTQPTTAPQSEPNLPDYPWDEDVDY